MTTPARLGTLVIISAPSGGGKTTVVNRLVAELPGAARLITCTSRPPRAGETREHDYHFLTEAEFQKKVDRGDFLEYVEYADHWYGIDRHELYTLLALNDYVVVPVDAQGRVNLQGAKVPTLSIYLLPESLGVIKERLMRRPDMTPEELAERMEIARFEMSAAPGFDLRVVNRNGRLDDTVAEVVREIKARTK